MIDVGKISRDGKMMLLAYDQGFEHGPADFDDDNVDPQQIIDIARKAGVFTGIVFQAGVAQKYAVELPLVVKLNGKTSFHAGEEPVSLQIHSVDNAVELKAAGVGYTIYVGSEHEEEMIQEFGRIVEEAHAKDLVVIAWMYPRGKHVEGKETSRDTVAYAARLALELGADVVKLPYTGDAESFKWVVKSAGKTKIVAQGGTKKEEMKLIEEIKEIMSAGAAGMAIGRNIWQSDDPVGLSKKIAEVIWQ